MSIPAGLRAAFFDLDGTLMDREPLMQAAVADLFVAHGSAPAADDLAALVGRAWPDVHRALGVEASLGLDLDAFLADVLGRAERLVDGGFATEVLAGGRELVERLHRAGVPVLLVTGSLRREADAAIAHLGIGGCLRGVLAAEDYAPGKPDPACYLAASRLVGGGDGALVFEDSEVGVDAARAAGLRVLATEAANRPPGDPSHQDLRRADVVVAGLDEVTDAVLARALGPDPGPEAAENPGSRS